MEHVGERLWLIGPTFSVASWLVLLLIAAVCAIRRRDTWWLWPACGLAFGAGMGIAVIGMLLVAWALPTF